MFVKPKAGLIVRDPRTRRPLPTSGKRVPNSSYWRRRAAAGDVEIVEPSKGDEKPTKAAAAEPTRQGKKK